MEYNKSLSARIKRRNKQGFKGEGTHKRFVSVSGDYTSMAYSDELYAALWYRDFGEGITQGSYGPNSKIYTSGLNRFFTNWENRPGSAYVTARPKFMWSNYRTDSVGSKLGDLHWILATMTLPINAALYFGKWQSDANGNWNNLDATSAVREVTKSAYTKLKQEYGDNLRIYLIKYRKQTQYKHPVTGEPVEFDYSYLDSCASGSTEPYLYDISTKEELENALTTIANDIKEKNFAGYEEAKNVD